MKLPTSIYSTCTPSGNGSVPPVVTPLGSQNASVVDFAMVDRGISSDPRLKHIDVRIYNVLAGCRVGARVKMGMRLIAKSACTSLRHVRPSLERLIEYGYVKAVESKGVRDRSEYRLTFWRFSAKKAGAEVIVQEAAAKPLVTCPRCSKKRRMLLKTGWCKSCAWELRVDGISERAARRVIQEESVPLMKTA
jgi:hypothetical protein